MNENVGQMIDRYKDRWENPSALVFFGLLQSFNVFFPPSPAEVSLTGLEPNTELTNTWRTLSLEATLMLLLRQKIRGTQNTLIALVRMRSSSSFYSKRYFPTQLCATSAGMNVTGKSDRNYGPHYFLSRISWWCAFPMNAVEYLTTFFGPITTFRLRTSIHVFKTRKGGRKKDRGIDFLANEEFSLIHTL